MVGVGCLASLKLGYGHGGRARVGSPFTIQVLSGLRIRLKLLTPDLDSVVGAYDAHHRKFRVQFTVETGITPREPDPWMDRFRWGRSPSSPSLPF